MPYVDVSDKALSIARETLERAERSHKAGILDPDQTKETLRIAFLKVEKIERLRARNALRSHKDTLYYNRVRDAAIARVGSPTDPRSRRVLAILDSGLASSFVSRAEAEGFYSVLFPDIPADKTRSVKDSRDFAQGRKRALESLGSVVR